MELIENLFVGGNVSDLETIVYSLRREVPVLDDKIPAGAKLY